MANVLVVGDVLYVADFANGRVQELQLPGLGPVPGGSIPVQPNPYGLASDTSGNLYVGYYSAGLVQIFNNSGSLIGSVPTGGLVMGVFVDANRDLYLSEQGPGQVQIFPWSGSSYGPALTITSPLFSTTLRGIVRRGNSLYVSDYDYSRVYELDDLGSYSFTAPQIVINGGAIVWPTQLSMDSLGELYVSSRGNDSVAAYLPQSSQGAVFTLDHQCILAGYNPQGTSVDPATGNIYLSTSVAPFLVSRIGACVLPATTTRTATLTQTPTRTATGTPSSTASNSPTLSPTASASPTFTRTATITPSSSPTPSATGTPTRTVTSSRTPTPTATATPTPSFTKTPTRTATGTPSSTASNSPTLSPTASASPTFTRTSTITPSSSPTPSATGTPTRTATSSRTPTSTATVTPTLSFTGTYTLTFTPSPSPTQTNTPTWTRTPTITSTPTQTFTPTDSPSFPPNCGAFKVSRNYFRPSDGPVSIYWVDCGQYQGVYSLILYNSAGEHIRTMDMEWGSGPFTRSVLWDGRNKNGEICASGVYFLEKKAPYRREVRRILLVR